MPIPGVSEPGSFSGQQQVQEQQSINISSAIPIKKRRSPMIQQKSNNFTSAIPIKKRRFPMIQEKSASPVENPPISEGQDAENQQEHKISDEGQSLSDARNTSSPVNPDVSRTSFIAVKKEVTPTNIQLGQVNVDTFAPKALEPKPSISLGPLDDLGNKKDILQGEKSSEPRVPDSSIAAQTANLKQEFDIEQTEGTHRLEPSAKMNVELSLGPKEPLVPASKQNNIEAVVRKSEKSDSSLLSLALHDKKLVLHDKNGITMCNDSNGVSSNRSNWDLNTTMDVWEGSMSSDAFAHRLFDVGGLSKSNSCPDHKSSLTTAGTVGLFPNKGKRIVDVHASSFSNVSIQPSQKYKTNDSLGLRLAMPIDTGKEHSSLSDNLVSASTCPNLNLKQVQLPNVSRTVKSEPVEDDSKHDCSVGSSSSSSMELLKCSSVKRETANNHSVETVLQSSISLEKFVDCRSIKSEMVQERIQEASEAEDAAVQQSVGKIMQHQESCASSSALEVPLIQRNPCPSRLPTCSELTTCGDLSNQSEQSFHSKDLRQSDGPDEPVAAVVSKHLCQDHEQLRPCKVGSFVVDSDKCELARVDELMHELSQNSEVAANDEVKITTSPGMLGEDAFGSEFESQENCAVDTLCGKEDDEYEEYEDGEVREPMQRSAAEDPIVAGRKTEKLELVGYDSRDVQPLVPLPDKNIRTSDFEGKGGVGKNQEDTSINRNNDCVGICHELNLEDNSSQKNSDGGLGVLDLEKKSISVASDKQLDLSGKDVEDSLGKEVHRDVQDSPRKEVLTDVPINGSNGVGIELVDEAIEKVVKENCSGKDDLTLSKVEASSEGHDAVKGSNNVGNKSRIINLSRDIVTSPCKTKSIPNRLLTTRSGKERHSDLDGEMQQRGVRDEFYAGGSNKFVKDKAHDQSFRNSRPNFMRGKGRMSGRFGSLRGEWNSDHDFASENSYGPNDYRVIRRKQASSVSDVDLECNGYGVRQDGNAFADNRRRTMNDEFPSTRRTSFRRLSSGDRDGPMTRGMQMLHRFPRNMSPRRCSNEAGSDVMGLRQDDKFMRLSDNVVDPDYDRSQAMYDELNGQLVRGNRNFTNMQRKGYPRIRSKSPARSRTRSPGPWSSPRRRSPNGLPEFTQHRSPALFRTGRMRSPDRSCFRDEMVPRRRGSPPFVARHTNDMRDVDSGRELVHPRSSDANRRSSPGRVFPRNSRRGDALDSREMEDGDDYMNGPLPSNKFPALRGDGSIDERRKYIERRGPPRSFRQNFSNDTDNFRFPMNDGPRPYRFCPDAEAEFVERNNTREREFDGRMKHQPMIASRRIRDMEEQQDGNYRPVERVWHDDGFTDTRGKRRRF